MPIRVFIQDQGGFTHEEAGFLILAFEYTLRKVRCVNRTDTVAVVIAKQILASAKNGERDPLNLSAKALAALRVEAGDKARRSGPGSVDREESSFHVTRHFGGGMSAASNT